MAKLTFKLIDREGNRTYRFRAEMEGTVLGYCTRQRFSGEPAPDADALLKSVRGGRWGGGEPWARNLPADVEAVLLERLDTGVSDPEAMELER